MSYGRDRRGEFFIENFTGFIFATEEVVLFAIRQFPMTHPYVTFGNVSAGLEMIMDNYFKQENDALHATAVRQQQDIDLYLDRIRRLERQVRLVQRVLRQTDSELNRERSERLAIQGILHEIFEEQPDTRRAYHQNIIFDDLETTDDEEPFETENLMTTEDLDELNNF